MSKVNDKKEDKTVKLIRDTKGASRKWTRKRKPNTKWPAGPSRLHMFVNHCRDPFWGGDRGIFLGE